MLSSEKIEYLLVGGYAVSFHGYPRPTGDLDIWVALNPENARKLSQALSQFGFSEAGTSAEIFLQPGRVVRMGVPPVRIEIINTISGVDFDRCYPRAVNAVVDQVPVRVIGRDDLITNKRAAARDKDLNDVKQLDRSAKP